MSEPSYLINKTHFNTILGYSSSSRGQYGIPMVYERSFRWKLGQFRYLCHSNSVSGHIKISVTRQTLFEDSFHQVMRLPAYELRRRLFIIFRGEDGLDYGGVARWVVFVCVLSRVPFNFCSQYLSKWRYLVVLRSFLESFERMNILFNC